MDAAKPRDTVTPSAEERSGLDDVRRLRRGGSLVIHGPNGKRLDLPPSLLEVMDRALESFAAGDSVAVLPVDRLLTTQEAADLLNVSRQYLVRLLDAGQIPSTRTGSHRRVLVADILAFKSERDDRRRAALAEIAQIHQEAGGYDDEP